MCRAFKALGKCAKDIIAVTMPAFGTTAKTKSNSIKLIKALGATPVTVPVGNTVLKHFKDIGHKPDDKNVTYENAQARMRTLVLMDIANDNNGLVIGTGDLSELALGWATYNGDHMSMYGVNASVPKTLVKHLIGHEAKKLGGKYGNQSRAVASRRKRKHFPKDRGFGRPVYSSRLFSVLCCKARLRTFQNTVHCGICF